MSLPTCPTDCTNILANWAFDECSPEWAAGEIGRVFLFGIGYPIANDPKTDPAGFLAAVNARMSNTSAAANAIRVLTVIGEKPEPETNIIKMSNNREIVTTKKHQIVFDIDEMSQENRDAIRQLECGNKFLMMFESGEKLLWGGSDHIGDGIEGSFIANLVIPRDRSGLTYYRCTFTWEDKFHPDSVESPLL